MQKNYTILLILLMIPALAWAQKRRPAGPYNPTGNVNSEFLSKQWWIGLKAGPNLSRVNVDRRYTAIAPVNYQSARNDKEYDNFNKLGTLATLDIGFSYNGFTASIQPSYRHMRFTYSNGFEWSDTENTDNRLLLNYVQEQRVDYADLPLILKYDLTRGKVRPYLQAGVFYSMLITAFKSVEVSGTDYASGAKTDFTNEPIIVGATDLFANHYWGLEGGAGLSYHLGNIRLNLDVLYLKGMSNITSANHRYDNDRLSGIGEALDDLKADNFVISIGCYLPTRFLTKSFQSVNR